MFKLFRLPKIRIHVWGGLGSQLHAWYLFESLSFRYPKRKFKLLFHTSGITRRLPEIVKYLPDGSTIIIDDFSPSTFSKSRSRISSHFNMLVRLSVKRIISRFLINARFDHQQDATPIRGWTFAIRGHYSRNRIDDFTLKLIAAKLELTNNLSGLKSSSFVIHVRLGDLLVLEDKFPTDVNFVGLQIKKILETKKYDQIRIHSDSPERASQILNHVLDQEIEFVEGSSPINALLDFIQADCFLGTSSKLSIWAAIFREYLNKHETYLPSNLQQNFQTHRPLGGKFTPFFY